MARVSIPTAVRRRVTEQAEYRCGYCQTPQSFTAMPLHVEHIIPLAAGGSSSESNLWLACPLCNGHKGVQTVARDPVTGLKSLCSILDANSGRITFAGARMASIS